MGKFLQFLEIYKPRPIATGEQDFVDTHKVEKKDYPSKNEDDIPFKAKTNKFKNRGDQEPIKEQALSDDEKVFNALKNLAKKNPNNHSGVKSVYGHDLTGFHTHHEIAKEAGLNAVKTRNALSRHAFNKTVHTASHENPKFKHWQRLYKAKD